MRYSIRGLLALLTFTAIGVAAISIRTRPVVAVLSLVTTLTILYALLAAILRASEPRRFWIGFVVFALGYFFWVGGPGNREFYTIPGVIAEWLSGPETIYSEYSRYDAVSSATPSTWRTMQALRGRIRYAANCLATVYFGILGGFLATRMRTFAIASP